MNRNIKSTGGLALIVVVLSALLIAVIFWSVNRNSLPGSDIHYFGSTPVAGAGGGSLPTATPAPTATPQPTATPGAAAQIEPFLERLTAETVCPGTNCVYALGCIGNCTGSTSAANMANDWDNELFAYPFWVENEQDFDSITFAVKVADVGKFARFGFYEVNQTTLIPTDLKFDGGTFSVGSIGVQDVLFAAQTFTAKTWYAIAFVTESTTADLQRYNSGSANLYMYGLPFNNSNRINWAVRDDHTCGLACVNALPDPIVQTGILNTAVAVMPYVFVGVD